jgi:hypothetical protein
MSPKHAVVAVNGSPHVGFGNTSQVGALSAPRLQDDEPENAIRHVLLGLTIV